METVFVSTENNKANENHRFRLVLTDKLNHKDSNKSMTLANLSL